MHSKLDEQTYTSEFESHWVPLSYGLVPHLSQKLSKLPCCKIAKVEGHCCLPFPNPYEPNHFQI